MQLVKIKKEIIISRNTKIDHYPDLIILVVIILIRLNHFIDLKVTNSLNQLINY